MPWINLIEVQRNEVKQLGRKARMFFLAFVSVSAVGVVGFGYLWYETEIANTLERKLSKQITRIEPLLTRIKTQDAQLAAMGPRLSTLEGAQQDTQRWKRILDHLTQNTPEDIWLTNVRCTGGSDGKPVVMEVKGMGSGLESIGQFLLRQEACPDFRSVTLKQSTERSQGGFTGIEFSALITVEGIEEEAPKASENSKDDKGGPA
ncbi:MAG: hypothetical protein HONBIEJF_01236 [Fimbriimonadaceae bacterium]|nr:hypothetical protein [Fimbriimonadaceae bacterium]